MSGRSQTCLGAVASLRELGAAIYGVIDGGRPQVRLWVGWSGREWRDGGKLNIYNNMKIQKYKNKIREYSNNIQQQQITTYNIVQIQRNIAGGTIDLFLCSLSATKYFLNSRQQ